MPIVAALAVRWKQRSAAGLAGDRRAAGCLAAVHEFADIGAPTFEM
jgi:hypothetical protein